MGITLEMMMLAKVWSKKNRTKRPAVFLDRDGTLIKHREVSSKMSHMQPLPGVPAALAKLQKFGYLLIIVTNQPNIEKGVVSALQTIRLHRHLYQLLRAKGVRLDAVYVCPHRYPSTCTCRKPGQAMIKRARKDFNIDMKKSWFIGDTGRDMETGKRAGLRTIFVKTGEGSKDPHFKTKGQYNAEDFSDAAAYVLK